MSHQLRPHPPFLQPPPHPPPHRPCRSRSSTVSVSATATSDPAADNMKTIVQKTLPGDVPFPWSEKDPYRLPVSIDRVQKMLITLGEGGGRRTGVAWE
jgi:hypothetical protein